MIALISKSRPQGSDLASVSRMRMYYRHSEQDFDGSRALDLASSALASPIETLQERRNF